MLFLPGSQAEVLAGRAASVARPLLISSKRSHDYIEISGSGGRVGWIQSERW